ncbi:lipid-A-disaccharide synthase [bacterium]|nr:lipid-A-disaccharide synthase [bacterium]
MTSVMFIAGEASGDAHAAAVIGALRRQVSGLAVCAAGGPRMQQAGAELIFDLTEYAVIGLVEVLKNFGEFRRIFYSLLAEVARRQPAAVVLVDFPGFNLRFARAVRRRHPGIKIIYYISPQLWAWHASRARQIERDVDLLLTIFPFEKNWYAARAPQLRVEFVGHPFADYVSENPKSESRNPKQVLLLSGSREREVAKIFPILTRVVDRLPAELEFVAAAADEQTARLMRHPRVAVEVGTARAQMTQAALALSASGTATMECAFAGCPMLVVYKVNWLTYLIARLVVTVDWLAMPNVIAGREIVPEYIQHHARPERIAAAARALLEDPVRREAQQRDLAAVVRSLGGPGAGERAARLIAAEIAAA